MEKIAFLFPGQGSQKVGMGQDLYKAYPEAREIFEAADSVTGLSVTRLCFEGPMDALTETINLQPAITAVNLACLEAVLKAGIRPAVCAGHSLGEYSALHAAGVISARDCLRSVFMRGRLMHREAGRRPGAMCAIVGLSIEQVNAVVAQAAQGGVVAVANHNSAEQIVITGESGPVRMAGELAVAQGGKAVALKVSGAWHSPLIRGAEEEFESFLETLEFGVPIWPVIHNVTAEGEIDPQRIKALMVQQLCRPVRWFDTMQRLIGSGITMFVEIGPGRVLSGLLKKGLASSQPAQLHNVYDLKSLEQFLQKVA